MARKSRVLTDHDEIRRWAEERDAQPACVRGTGSEEDVGMIRLDFPGYSGETSLEPVEWDEWFQKFDDNNLALLVEETAGGEQSNFNKIIGRETAAARAQGRKASRRAERGADRAETRVSGRRSASSARGSSRRTRRSGSRRASSSRSSRSRSGRKANARGSSSSRSRGKVAGKKRAQGARSSSRSRSRRRAA